jgi:dipeptidase
MTTYVPIYAGVTDLPEEYKTDGHTTGFSRRSAWWAFKQVATIAAHRWGDMRNDVAAVRVPLQDGFLIEQKAVADKACELLKQEPAKAGAFLTEKTAAAARQSIDAYWNLGTLLWNKYDEQW